MEIFAYMNERVKKFSIWDLKLAQWIGIFATLIVVKLVPQILDLSIWWFVALLILCALRPLYVLFVKK